MVSEGPGPPDPLTTPVPRGLKFRFNNLVIKPFQPIGCTGERRLEGRGGRGGRPPAPTGSHGVEGEERRKQMTSQLVRGRTLC